MIAKTEPKALSCRRQSSWMYLGDVAEGMRKISYAGYRFPHEAIHQAVWLYLRFTLSFRDVDDLLAERGIAVSYESVHRWVNHFGPMIGACASAVQNRMRSGILTKSIEKSMGGWFIYGAPSTPRARFSMCWSSPSATSTPL
jgi:hypothetical protein